MEAVKGARIFFCCWILYFLFEYYIFGPYSFIELSHEGNLNVAMNYYLSHGYDGGHFTQQLGGGQDVYSVLPGKQYLNSDLLLSYIFPTWIVILSHKLVIAALGFIGAYLLVRRVVPDNRVIAVAVATVFPVSHQYLLNFSTNWGPGMSAMPLAVYVCVACSRDKHYYRWVFLVAVIIAASDPIHLFPPLGLAVIGYAILMKGVDLKRVTIGFGIFVLFSLLSWHEFLYANILGTVETARINYTSDNFTQELASAVGYLMSTWVATSLYLAGALILLVRKDRLAMRSFFVLALVILAYPIVQTFPWESVGLSFVNKVSHYYMLIAIITLFIPVSAQALAGLAGNRTGGRRLFRPEILVLAMGLSILTWNKFMNFGNFLWFGGQGNFFGYETLSKPDWNPDRNYRVLTLFETPPTNVVSGFYGFDSFDGHTNLRSKRWDRYWFGVMRRDQSHDLSTRAGIKWRYWDGKTYDVEKHIRLDLIKVANVRYLFSALPLASGDLTLVSASEKQDWAKVRPDFFNDLGAFMQYRLRRIFNPGKLYVYELPNALPRIFAARKIEVVSNSIDEAAYHNRIAAATLTRTVFVQERHKSALVGPGKLKIMSFQKVVDGYDISVDAAEGGTLVLNNSYLSFWQAFGDDGKPLTVTPANVIHMAVAVPPGTKNVKVRYNRPLLRDKLAAALR